MFKLLIKLSISRLKGKIAVKFLMINDPYTYIKWVQISIIYEICIYLYKTIFFN